MRCAMVKRAERSDLSRAGLIFWCFGFRAAVSMTSKSRIAHRAIMTNKNYSTLRNGALASISWTTWFCNSAPDPSFCVMIQARLFPEEFWKKKHKHKVTRRIIAMESNAYLTVRRYDGVTDSKEAARRVQEGFVPLVSK